MSRRFGVDTSKWDGPIDVAALRAAGVEFVIAKCGGSDEGMYPDSQWERTYAACRAAGMPIGTYYFSSAITVQAARDEAAHCLSLIEGKQLDYPVYMDFETGAQQGMGEGSRRKVMQAWVDAIGGKWLRGVYTWSWLMPSGVTDCELWTCAWTATRPANNCGMWQFGGESNVIRSTAVGPYDPIDQDYAYVDYPSIVRERGLNGYAKEGGGMTQRERVVERARGQLGEPYYSMNYSAEEGFGGLGTHYVGAGWGCAQFVAYCLNTVLGTEYVGSCYNYAGDALGVSDRDYTQGGGEFEFVEARDAQPGDAVLYAQAGHDGTDYDDYGHIALYVGGGEVIGAMGGGKPGQSGYLNIGISRTSVAKQSLGGPIRYVRCRRLRGNAKTPSTGNQSSYADTGEMVWVKQKVTVRSSTLNVRDKPSTKTGAIKAEYRKGDVIYLDGLVLGDGYVWGSYVGATSGKRRYVALGDLELAQ